MATDEAAANPCPVCQDPLEGPAQDNRYREVITIRCGNCGTHRITMEAIDDLPGIARNAAGRARIAYGVRKVPERDVITSELVEDLARVTQLPGAIERLDNLVVFMASTFAPGERRRLDPKALRATLGAADAEGALWVIDEAIKLGLVDVPNNNSEFERRVGIVFRSLNAALTIDGWRRHAELMRDGARSAHAFMAMKFGDGEMDHVFSEFMRPAVAQTGFDLRTTVGDHQTAGSIDNRMRVEIRTSRFVLCDLTHGNQGAYWEAGFAEGLGRPVIYTCRRDVLETPKAVHFDTDHQLIIKWDLANMNQAMHELKATIRATLPAEARLED
jgi:hypothetical protein